MTESLLALPVAAFLVIGLLLTTGALLERQAARQEANRAALEMLARNPSLPWAETGVRGVSVRLRR